MKPPRESEPRLLVLGLLCVLPLLAWTSAWKKSPTFDEPYHLAVGYAAWVDGAQHWDFIHPTLARRWIAVPLLFLQPDLPARVTNQGELAHEFIFHNRLSAATMFRLTRLMMLFPAVWLAWGVYLWSRELFGIRAAILCLLCFVVDPNVLAHARLSTNDIMLAATFFWTVFLFWRLRRKPGLRSAFWAGLVLGLALTSKYSSLMLVPTLWLLLAFAGPGPGRRRYRAGLVAFGIAVAVILLESGVEMISLAEFANEQLALKGEPLVGDWPAWATIRVPFLRYLYGIWTLFNTYSEGRPTFLLGRLLPAGTPLYFPVVFLYKTPLTVLALALWGSVSGAQSLVRSLRKRNWSSLHAAMFICLPASTYALLAVAGRLNLGYRHLLPVLPFLYLGIGRLAKTAHGRRARFALTCLILGLILESQATFPHYLAFFNLAVGGPAAGHHHLADSNLDWGQELIALSDYQAAHQIGVIHLGYFGSADPSAYGVQYQCLPSLGLLDCPEADLPTDGWVAVSATCLQGLCTSDPDFYASLRARDPTDVLGHSLFLYRLP